MYIFVNFSFNLLEEGFIVYDRSQALTDAEAIKNANYPYAHLGGMIINKIKKESEKWK